MCKGFRKDGKPCARKTKNLYCYQHSPKAKNLCNERKVNGTRCLKERVKGEIVCLEHFKNKPKFIEEKPESCPICFDNFKDGDIYLECGHWIHIECIVKSSKEECPLCKGKVMKLTKKEKDEIEKNRKKMYNYNYNVNNNDNNNRYYVNVPNDIFLYRGVRESGNSVLVYRKDNDVYGYTYDGAFYGVLRYGNLNSYHRKKQFNHLKSIGATYRATYIDYI